MLGAYSYHALREMRSDIFSGIVFEKLEKVIDLWVSFFHRNFILVFLDDTLKGDNTEKTENETSKTENESG